MVYQANKCNYIAEDYDTDASEKAMEDVLKNCQLKSRAQKDVADVNDPKASIHTFTGLLGGIEYAAIVRARNRCGWSDWSEILTLVTPTSEPERCPQAVPLEKHQN